MYSRALIIITDRPYDAEIALILLRPSEVITLIINGVYKKKATDYSSKLLLKPLNKPDGDKLSTEESESEEETNKTTSRKKNLS